MMNVPIDDGDPFEIAVLLQVLRGDGHRIEVAEAQRLLSGVMTRRPNKGKTILQLAINDVLGQFDRVSDRQTTRAGCEFIIPDRVGVVMNAEATAR